MLPLRTLRIRHIFLALANVARLTDAFMRLKRPRPELQQRPLRHAWSIWRASLKTILAALAVRELRQPLKVRMMRQQCARSSSCRLKPPNRAGADACQGKKTAGAWARA